MYVTLIDEQSYLFKEIETKIKFKAVIDIQYLHYLQNNYKVL